MQTYKKNAGLVEQIVDGELVVLDQDSGQIHQFNATASEIWTCLDGKTSIEDVIKHIADLYGIEQNIARKDVESTLELLQKQNLIEI